MSKTKNAPKCKLKAASGKSGQFKCYHGITGPIGWKRPARLSPSD